MRKLAKIQPSNKKHYKEGFKMDMSIFYSPLLGDKNQQLLQAVHNGDLKQVKELLANGATVFNKFSERVVDHNRYTTLMLAVDQDRVDILQELIKKAPAKTIKQEIRCENINTVIQFAVSRGRVDALKLLIGALQKNSKESALKDYLNIKSHSHYYTAFAYACKEGDLVMMEILAKAGADTCEDSFKDQKGYISLNNAAPMLVAIKNGHLDVIIALIKKYKNNGFATDFLCSNPDDIFNNKKSRAYFLAQGIVHSANLEQKKLLDYFVGLFNDEKKLINIQDLNATVVELLKSEQLSDSALSLIKFLAPHVCAGTNISDNDQLSLLDLAVSQNHPSAALVLIQAGQSFLHFSCSDHLKLILSEVIKKAPDIQNVLPKYILSAMFAQIKKDDLNFQLNLKRCLLKASELGLTHVVQYFVMVQKINPDVIFTDHSTPLLLAIENGRIETVRFLISKKVDLNRVHPTKNTPLDLAISRKQEAVAMHLIASGADVRLADQKGHTPLMRAVHNNLKIVVQFILAKHPDTLSATSLDGENALMFASLTNNIGMIQTLCKSKIDLNMKDNKGKTALAHGMESQNLLAVEQLISLGANTDDYHPDVIFILQTGFREKLKSEMQLFIQFVKDQNPEMLNEMLKIMVRNNRVLFIEPLLRLGANANWVYQDGLTPLFLCVEHDNLDSFETLILYGANINFFNVKNPIALFHMAADAGNLPMMKRLEELQAENPDDVDWAVNPPLHLAVKNNHAHVVKYLLTQKAYSTAELSYLLKEAFLYKNPETMEALFEHKPDLSLKINGKHSALFFLAGVDRFENNSRNMEQLHEEKCVKIVDVLIKSGVNPLLEPAALKVAVEKQNVEVASRLICAVPYAQLNQLSKQPGMLQKLAKKTLNTINDFHILFINLLKNNFNAHPTQGLSFVNLPQELKTKVLSYVSFPAWYGHRLNLDLRLAFQKINSMQEVKKIATSVPALSPPVLFLAQTQTQEETRKRRRNVQAAVAPAQTFEQNKQTPKKRKTSGS